MCRKKGIGPGCPPSLPGPGIWVAKKGVNLVAFVNLLKAVTFRKSKIAKPTASWTEKGVRIVALQLVLVSLCSAPWCRPPVQS